MALTSTGYFRQRLTDESMSPDIVFFGMFLVSQSRNELSTFINSKKRYLRNKNNVIFNRTHIM